MLICILAARNGRHRTRRDLVIGELSIDDAYGYARVIRYSIIPAIHRRELCRAGRVKAARHVWIEPGLIQQQTDPDQH